VLVNGRQLRENEKLVLALCFKPASTYDKAEKWPLPLNNSSSIWKTAGFSLATRSKTLSRPRQLPKTLKDLARELVKQKKLTKFQAEEVYRGKGKSLVPGNYVLMEKIGVGGMGQVFKAGHSSMDRFVAAGRVDCGQFVPLRLVLCRQFFPLTVQIRIFCVGLGADGDVFARSHRHGTGDKARHPGNQNVAGCGMCGRHADHQARRGHDAVIGSQDGSAQPTNPIRAVSLSVLHEHTEVLLWTILADFGEATKSHQVHLPRDGECDSEGDRD